MLFGLGWLAGTSGQMTPGNRATRKCLAQLWDNCEKRKIVQSCVNKCLFWRRCIACLIFVTFYTPVSYSSSSYALCCISVECLEWLCRALQDNIPCSEEACHPGAQEWRRGMPSSGGEGWLCGVLDSARNRVQTVPE